MANKKMSVTFRAGTHIFLIPLGPWNTTIKVVCVILLVTQIVPGSRSIIIKIIFSDGKRSSQPKYHIPRRTTVTSSLKTKLCRKIQIESVKMKMSTNKTPQKIRVFFCFFFSCPKDPSTQKLGS